MAPLDVTDLLGELETEIIQAAERGPQPADGPELARAARAEASGLTSLPEHHAAAVRRATTAGLAVLAAAGALDRPAAEALRRLSAAADEIALAALTHTAITALSLGPALAAQWAILRWTSPLDAVSVWRQDDGRRLECRHAEGMALPGSAAGLAERCLVAAAHTPGAEGLTATPIRAFGSTMGALVWHTTGSGDLALARLAATLAARALSTPLQLALTVDENHHGQQALVQAPERRLRRLSLDLHDGAMQEVALITGELRRLEDELRPALKGRSESERIRSLLGTLAGLLEALDANLREVATTFELPGMLRRSLPESMASMLDAFRARSGIDAVLEVTGSFEEMTDSQRIALHRVVQECLSNIRQHAQATSTSVTVRGRHGYAEAAVVDDGAGFDVPAAMQRATRDGRLGLVGMVERIRLLGGRCEIISRRGEGTRVQVHLTRYEPTDDRRA